MEREKEANIKKKEKLARVDGHRRLRGSRGPGKKFASIHAINSRFVL